MAVSTIIADSNARADAAISDAQYYLNELGEIATEDKLNLSGSWILKPGLTLIWDNINITEPTQVSYAEPSGLEDLAAFQKPTVPDVADSVLPTLWTDDTVPELTATAPEITIPEKPDVPLPTAPSAHVVQDVTLHDWIETTFPDQPSLDESPLPAPDELNVLAVDMTLPVNTLVAPENVFSFEEAAYSTELLTALDTLLVEDLTNGGYGIDSADEQALFDRARDRENRQSSVNVRQVRERVAARKFPVPPGMLYEAEQQEVQRGAAALSDVNKEILLQRSERYVQARQFAVQQGLSLEQALLSYTSSKEDRALRAAESTADFAIRFHNAAVSLFELDISLRQLYRDLHAEHLQTVLAKVEEYRMKLQHIDAEDKRNTTRVQLYQQLLGAVKLFYDAQIARDRRTEVEVQIETLKLEQSKSETEVYIAQTRGRRDAFDAFATEIQGERLKLDVFNSQLTAHDQQVGTVLKTSQLKQSQFDAELRNLTEQRQNLNLQLQRVETELRTKVAETDAFAKANNEDISLWKTGLDVQQFNSRISYERNVEMTNKYLAATRENTSHLNTSMGVINDYDELKAGAAKSAIGLYETQIAGAEGALSSIASLAESAA